MFLKKSLLLVFTAFVLCECGFVEQIRKCKLRDDECKRGLIKSVITILAKTGIPEKGFPKIDPLAIKNVSLSIVDVIDITLFDGVAKGIKNCDVSKLTTSTEHERASIEMICNITIKGSYKAFSAHPFIKTLSAGDTVNGEGKGKVIIERLFLRLDFDYFFQNRDGKIYIKCINDKFKYQYDVKGKMMFFADNLYIGGQESSKAVMDLMNQNWKSLMTSFGKPFMEKAMDFVMKAIQKFFDSVSADQLFEDDLTQYVRDE